jgi:integrase/recombinase XerD
MKIERHGQAKILTQQEIELLFNKGLQTARDRTLFGVCLYTACRIAEACSLMVKDIYTNSGAVRSTINERKANTKGKLQTRTIPVIEDLLRLLTSWRSHAGFPYLFPGRHPNHHCPHLHPDERGQDFEKSVLASQYRGSLHPQLPSHRPESDEQRRHSAADYSRNQRAQ